MVKKLIWAGWLFCLCVGALNPHRSLVPASASAQSFVSAKVVASEGQVEIRRETTGKLQVQNVVFKVSDELFAGDTIITGKNGRLVLGLSDGSQAVIAPKTTVILKDLSQSPRTLFQMIKGKTRIQIEKLGGQPNPYRVNTPTAVIAVRGTVFDVLADENQTEVFLHEGQVAVFNQRLLDQPLLLNAGQMTRVGAQRLPNTPSTFKIGRNDDTFRLSRQAGGLPGGGRIAERGTQPNNGRGGGAANAPGQPETGRNNPRASGGTGGVAGPGGVEGARPNAGRSAPSPSTPKPSAEPRGSVKRPS
jgi:hypothetical protein